jgi:hypothetical protein
MQCLAFSELHYPSSKPKSVHVTTEKVMLTLSWAMNGIIGNRFPAERIHRKSEELGENDADLCPVTSSCSMTAHLDTSQVAVAAVKELPIEVLPCLTLSPYFTPSSYNHFECLKAACGGIHYCADEEVQSGV